LVCAVDDVLIGGGVLPAGGELPGPVQAEAEDASSKNADAATAAAKEFFIFMTV
jgi:hypothetical protein